MNECEVLTLSTCFNCILYILLLTLIKSIVDSYMRLMTSRIVKLIIFSALLPLSYASAEMTSLSDNDLSEVDGAGIGFVMDDFVFSHGNDAGSGKVFKISGLNDSNGEPVSVTVNQLYIARADSDHGTNLNAVNLGRLSNPYEIDLLDGNDADVGVTDKAVLQFAAPSKVTTPGTGYSCVDPTLGIGSGDCLSRPAGVTTSEGVWANGERPDMGLELEIQTLGSTAKNLNFHVKQAVFDGSYMRLWGDDNQKMAAEFRLNFYTPELEISTCTQANQACTSSVKMQGFQLELALGTTFQPLYISADNDPINPTGGLTLEISRITHEYINSLNAGVSDNTSEGNAAEAFFTDYYGDNYRSNIIVGNLNVGGTDLGSAKVEGMLIQYLDVKFRDLDLVP